jgi:hypothetical protein
MISPSYIDTLTCGGGWSVAGNNCYSYSWNIIPIGAAQEHCSSLGGKLIEPANAEETNAVMELFNSLGIIEISYWIGINAIVEEGRYVEASSLK